MTPRTPDGGTHSPIDKNGHDQAQDRSIRDLHERMQQNDQDHSVIKDVLRDLMLSSENIRGDIRGSKMVAAALAFVFALVLGGIGWLVDRAATALDDVSKRTIEIDRRISMDWAHTRKIDQQVERLEKKHDHDVDDLRFDLREMNRNGGGKAGSDGRVR